MRILALPAFLLFALSLQAGPSSDDAIPLQDWTVDFSSPEVQAHQPRVKLIVNGRVVTPPVDKWEDRITSMVIPQTPTSFVPLAPCRVADTRGFGFTGAYGPPVLPPSGSRNFDIDSRCGIPAGARAVSFNFTVAEMGSAGNLKVFPAGEPSPTVSTVNWTGSTFVIANAGIVPLGANGEITVVNESTTPTQLIIDVNGYFTRTLVFTGSLNGEFLLGFPTSGGRIVLEIEGSGFRTAAAGPGFIGWNASFDGGANLTAATVYVNETNSHRAMVSFPLTFSTSPGQHDIFVTRATGTTTDANDWVTFSVIEYP